MKEIAKVDSIQMRLLEEVADLHGVPAGAYNIRTNGKMTGRANSANIEIISKEDGTGTVSYTNLTLPTKLEV